MKKASRNCVEFTIALLNNDGRGFAASYEISVPPQANVSIRKLPSNIQEQVFNTLKGLIQNPFPINCKKRWGAENCYEVPLGRSYRIHYLVLKKAKVVQILWAGPHQEDYRHHKRGKTATRK